MLPLWRSAVTLQCIMVSHCELQDEAPLLIPERFALVVGDLRSVSSWMLDWGHRR